MPAAVNQLAPICSSSSECSLLYMIKWFTMIDYIWVSSLFSFFYSLPLPYPTPRHSVRSRIVCVFLVFLWPRPRCLLLFTRWAVLGSCEIQVPDSRIEPALWHEGACCLPPWLTSWLILWLATAFGVSQRGNSCWVEALCGFNYPTISVLFSKAEQKPCTLF